MATQLPVTASIFSRACNCPRHPRSQMTGSEHFHPCFSGEASLGPLLQQGGGWEQRAGPLACSPNPVGQTIQRSRKKECWLRDQIKVDLVGSRRNVRRQHPARLRVCRLFCRLAVIEHSGMRLPSVIFKGQPRTTRQSPNTMFSYCPWAWVRRKQQPGRQSPGEGRRRHLAPGFRRPRKPLYEKQMGQDGDWGCPPLGHSAQSLPGSGTLAPSPWKQGWLLRDGNHRCLLPKRTPLGAGRDEVNNGDGLWNLAHRRQESLGVITPAPRGRNALHRDNIFLCNHGC